MRSGIYTPAMLRYAITDCTRNAETPQARREQLLRQVRLWCANGVNFMQLREKALPAGELYDLANAAMGLIAETECRLQLLVNGRVDVAVAAGAHGVHLTAAEGELTPGQARECFARAGRETAVISASCHTVEQTARARAEGANLILFGPVFEKVIGDEAIAEGKGMEFLRLAVEAAGKVPVLALGGVTERNAADCLKAGAAGVAAIRLFAEGLHRSTTE